MSPCPSSHHSAGRPAPAKPWERNAGTAGRTSTPLGPSTAADGQPKPWEQPAGAYIVLHHDNTSIIAVHAKLNRHAAPASPAGSSKMKASRKNWTFSSPCVCCPFCMPMQQLVLPLSWAPKHLCMRHACMGVWGTFIATNSLLSCAHGLS